MPYERKKEKEKIRYIHVNEMTRYHVPMEETSKNLTKISEPVYCPHPSRLPQSGRLRQ